jgi:hypothetical protein
MLKRVMLSTQGTEQSLILELINFTIKNFSAIQRKTLDPGLRRDDVGNFTVASKTTVITCM